MNSADEFERTREQLINKLLDKHLNKQHLESLNERLAQDIYNVSQGVPMQGETIDVGKANSVRIDKEVFNLINWLAKEQGISPELALKKALVNAAYIYNITTNRGDKLLVQKKDNSINKILLQ